MGPHGEPSSNRKNRATQSSFPKTEPELSFGWRSTAGSRLGTRRRSPPEDGRSVDGTDSQLHKQASIYTSKRLEVPTLCYRAIADGV